MEEKIIVQIASPERYYTKCYHDFMDCKLLNGEEKIIFLALKRFLNVKLDNGNVFPTIETIQEMTGWGNQKVVKYIKSLVKKGIVKKFRQGLSKPNIYILADYSTMWTCDNAEDMAAVADNHGIKPLTPAEHIAELERMGYTVQIKEKGLETEPTKAQNQAQFNQNLSKEQNTTDQLESQAERYTLKDIKALYEYENLTIQYPDKLTDIDIVFDILYETLNTTRQTIRIGGEDKPQMVIIGKLMKLQPDDLIYSIDVFHKQDQRIKNVKSYLLTILFHSREQNYLDLMNLGHHNHDF